MALASCSPGDEAADSTTTTEPATTSTASATTSTNAPASTSTTLPGEPSLINGTRVLDPELLERRVLAVKIDNHPRANPQSGIDQADMVIELLVEGITRFLTVWHESDSPYLGPMRSGRPTDPTLLAAFNEPTFAISGAQGWVQSIIRRYDLGLIKELSQGTFRISGRSAPHNLYVDTTQLRETADARDYPDEPPPEPIWEFGPMPEDAAPAEHVTIDFSGNTVIWNWDGASQLWYRTGYGEETIVVDEEGNENPIGVPVLVALYVDQYTACPGSGVSGSCVPSSDTTGSGDAFIFANGRVVEGVWERDSETEWFTLTDPDGAALTVPAGKVWLSLVPAGRGLSYE